MPQAQFNPVTPARLSWRDDTPEAPAFGDAYFARGQGPAESRAVFLEGNDLPARFAALPGAARFVIGETGFGTGLNFIIAATAFLEQAPADTRLHYLSVEQHPLEPADLARALANLPDARGLIHEFRAHYPPPTPGFHRLTLARGRIVLTLILGDATTMLEQLQARVDAWFLDGFAPARNPAMWQPALFRELARLSRPGTTLATFTAAGFVRRGLEAAGFSLDKVAGFGGKRHRLDGVMEGRAPDPGETGAGNIAVVGAGLAGATSARALAERGYRVRVLDGAGVAAGASGNRAGVLYTTPSAHPTPQNRFYQNSYLQALHWLHRYGFPRHNDEGALRGVIQQPADARSERKMRKARDSGLWPDELTLFSEHDGEMHLQLPGGGYIAPAAWCAFLLDHPGIVLEQTRVNALTPFGDSWRLDTDQGPVYTPRVVLANAAGARGLAGQNWLPLHSIRGQVSYVRATRASADWQQARCHRGYLTPALDGLHCVGATFDPHDDDPHARDADDQRNLDTLRQYRPEDWQALGGAGIQVADRRVGFRCQSPDFLPLVGPAVDDRGYALPGLYLHIAQGSRGLTGTPLCAEVLAALIADEPWPVDREQVEALQPKRFTGQPRQTTGARS